MELDKHQAIFEKYPGAFSLQIVQPNGEPCKNKKGECCIIYLHVLKTYQTPDLEINSAASLAAGAEEDKRLQDQEGLMKELMRIEQESKMVKFSTESFLAIEALFACGNLNRVQCS
jgi:hypothetical protein